MEPEFSNGLNSIYDSDRHRRPLNGYSHLQSQFSESPGQTGAHTLPPIQAQRPSYDYATSSSEQQARQPQHMYTTQANSYSTYAPPSSHHPYAYGNPHYPTTSSLLTSPTPAIPMTQGYGTAMTSQFPQIRPMPSSSSTQSHGLTHAYAPNPSPYGFPMSGEGLDVPPTHVVGSQGRRGILPSAEGKPAAVASNGSTGTKNTVIPQKDADGKYPCPHCQKTYLHGKHLKRHLLRHTGDRPYSCFLCNDTFSRSDILKRHFQKCSIRRGNPTGATHLSHSQNHLKKQAAKKTPTPSAINTTFPGVAHPGPHSASPIYHDGGLGVTIPSSNSQSQAEGPVMAGDGGSVRDHRSFTNPSMGFSRPNLNYLAGQSGSASLPSSGGSTPLTAKGAGHFQQPFGVEPAQHRMNSFAESNQRNGPPPLPSSHFDGSGYDLAGYSSNKDGELSNGNGEGRGIKSEGTNLEMKTEPAGLESR